MIEQRWKVNTVLDDKKYPYVIVDNWYTEKEENAVWKELDFYSVINQKEKRSKIPLLLKKMVFLYQKRIDFTLKIIIKKNIDIYLLF